MSHSKPRLGSTLDDGGADGATDIVEPGSAPPAESTATPAAAPPLIQVKNVGFAYPDGLRAVGDVSFDVGKGEIVSVIGPSGCGKSTLLRLIAGLRSPNDGAVERTGTEPGRLPCSMVFQEETLLPWLKVRDNVSLSYRFNRRKPENAEEHVDRLLDMVGLSEFADAWPSKLSGGMKRRVAVLTAIAPLPSLLLLDEPFSALDEPTRIGVHGDVYKLLREFEVGTVLVTHDLGEAITLSDRVLLLSRAPSRVVQEYVVPFGQERDLLALRRLPEFLQLYGSMWADMEKQIRPAHEGGASHV
jgi:NitT/TauT family transport system ATP-binding protein